MFQHLLRKVAALPLTIALLGTLLSVGGSGWVRDNIAAEAQQRFTVDAERIEAEVTRRLGLPVYGLRGAAGVYAASTEVVRPEFRAYVASRDMEREFPGVRGFGFIQHVQREDLDQFLVAARADGAPDFQLRQLDRTDWDDLYVIRYIEPLVRNGPAMGLDVGSEDRRRVAIQRAVDTGQATLTEPIALVQDGRKTPGFLLYQPIYRPGLPLTDAAERRAALRGVLYAPLVAEEILAGTVGRDAAQLNFRLHWGHTNAATTTPSTIPSGPSAGPADAAAAISKPINLVYAAHAVAADGAGVASEQEAALGTKGLTLTRALTILNSPFTLTVYSGPAFGSTINHASPLITLVGGLLLTAVVAYLAYLTAAGRQKAESLAQAMTADLDRLAMVAQHTGDGVFITDHARGIIWANEGLERITGLCAHDILGKHPRELLIRPLAGIREQAEILAMLQSDQPVRGEVCNEDPGGRKYWVEIEVQPLPSDKGRGVMAVVSDITARKQAGEALRASQAFLDAAGRVAGVGGWMMYADSDSVSWSDQACHLHAVPLNHVPTREEALSYFPPDARLTLAEAATRCLTDGTPFDLELPFTSRDGSALWVRVVGEAAREGHRIARIVGAVQDISARRALAARLHRHNETMSSILESLPCGLSVFNADLTLVTSNTNYRRMLDFPDSLFDTGVPTFEDFACFTAARGEFGSPEMVAMIKEIIREDRAPARFDRFEHIRPNGTALEVHSAPMPDGGFIVTYTDVSERHHAQLQVQRNEALMRGAIDTVNEAFVLYGPDDRLVFCNDKYRELYSASADLIVPGATFEDIVRGGAERGQYADAIGRVDEWVRERVEHHLASDTRLEQRLNDGRVVRVVERRMADGHIVGFRMDITDLVRASEAAEEASREKSQFLANMSHEIRTPMNAVLGMLALLGRSQLNPRQADYAAKAEGAARSLLGLLNDILDFSKVEAGKMTLDPQPFRPDDLLRDLSVVLSASARDKPLEVLFDIDPTLPTVLVGDSMRLQQILINLGGNAIKFTQQGEVVVSIQVVEQAADQVTLDFAVSDTGIGIAPEHRARIFTGFTQAEASTTRRFGGTGLGLAICQQLVELMGGTMQVDSERDRGSRFHFRIPLPIGATVAAVPSRPDLPFTGRAPRVLIADDNAHARETLSRLGAALGWSVETAVSGEAAIDRLRTDTEPFNAVFMDEDMPEMSGWQTVWQLRSEGLASEAKFILMVNAHGRDMLDEHSAVERTSLDGFLVKPTTLTMLREALTNASAAPLGSQPDDSRVTRVRPASDMVASGRLTGMRLLVVEDNENNRQVARELLVAEGADVWLAENGVEAVEAVAVGDPNFDVVLMDIQMPLMDGFTATRRIRDQLGRSHLPIVAMTANVMASDRQASQDAGMNAHVGKPFDLNNLVEVLLGVVHKSPRGAVALPPGIRTLPTIDLPANLLHAAALAGVDLEIALQRLNGRADVYDRLLRKFVGKLPETAERIASLNDTGDREAAVRELHTLKGLAGTLGASALAEQAERGEHGLRGEISPADAAALTRDMTLEIREAQIGLQAFLTQFAAAKLPVRPPAPRPTEENPRAAMVRSLESLKRLLADSDMAAVDEMERLKHRHTDLMGPAFVQLDEEIHQLHFTQALDLCNELLKEPSA